MVGKAMPSRSGSPHKPETEPRKGWILAEFLISLGIVVLLSMVFAAWMQAAVGRIATDVQGLRVIAETRYIHSTIQAYWRRSTVLSQPGPQKRCDFRTPEGLRHGISVSYGAWLFLEDGQRQPLSTTQARWSKESMLTVEESGLLQYSFGWYQGTRHWNIQSAVCPYECVYPQGVPYAFR